MICRTCKTREAERGRTCNVCRLEKRREAAKEYKARMRNLAREAKEQAAAMVEEPEREEVEVAPALDGEQYVQNLALDAAAGERMNLPIESFVGRRYARGAEWLLG